MARWRSSSLIVAIVVCAAVSLAVSTATAWSSKESANRTAAQKALEPFQQFVGSWKGVGQLRRGSSRGSWRETGAWAWKFSDKSAALGFEIKGGKYFEDARLTSLGKGKFRLSAQLSKTVSSKKESMVFEGEANKDGHLILIATKPRKDAPARVTLRTTASGKRLIILLERRLGTSTRFVRLAEIGYTRKGSGFGKGATFVECVVTGGKGTIPVTYKGRTYYVCCGGCRDLFNEDPAGILAEYAAKQKEKKKANN